jgi:hypothetical protein
VTEGSRRGKVSCRIPLVDEHCFNRVISLYTLLPEAVNSDKSVNQLGFLKSR